MKLLRKLLFPFSLIYWGITAIRNKLYDRGWLKSNAYSFPVISVGNLSTGGTGKSPMIEFLIEKLKNNWELAVLSRGYKRSTKGFKEVLVNSTVTETGDEPLQFKTNFPDVKIAVCEDRRDGIALLSKSAEMVLLDDAFQHRKVRPTYSILLTSFGNLFTDDWILPVGNLRESRSAADRANVLIVTKCPADLGKNKMEEIKNKLNPKSGQKVFFTNIGYGTEIKNNKISKPLSFLNGKEFILVTGIVNPKPLVEFLKKENLRFEHKKFGDHHNFSANELSTLETYKIILTTEKDYMRLRTNIKKADLYYLPIRTEFLNDTENEFMKDLLAGLGKANN